MDPQVKKSYILLHIAVILFGMTAIFGALIDLSAIIMVWWRVLITSASLILIPVVFKSMRTISSKIFWKFIGIGAIVALHWITFYGAIKLANASIALICFALMPLFTALTEPLITKKKINKTDILVSLLIVPGMILIVQNISDAYFWGVIVGLISAALVALFSSLTKKHIADSDPITISFIEMLGAFLSISLVLPIIYYYQSDLQFYPIATDWVYLLLLSLLCTSFAYVISTYALQYVSAFSSNMVINLEPIYGIIMAAVFLGEDKEFNTNFYIGALIMFTVVIAYPIYKSSLSKHKNNDIH